MLEVMWSILFLDLFYGEIAMTDEIFFIDNLFRSFCLFFFGMKQIVYVKLFVMRRNYLVLKSNEGEIDVEKELV